MRQETAEENRGFVLVGALSSELLNLDHRHWNLVAIYHNLAGQDDLIGMFAGRSDNRELFVAIILKEFNRLRPDARIVDIGMVKIIGLKEI